MKRIISIISDQVIADDLRQSFKICKEHGYEYVDLCSYNGKILEFCNDKEIEEIEQLLAENDLKVCSLASTLFMNCRLHDDYEIEKINPIWDFSGSADDHLEKFKEMIPLYRRLKAMNIRVFPFRWPANKGIVGDDDDLQLMADIFRKLADIAEENDVQVVVENCPYSHCPKGEMTHKLVEMVGSDHLLMLWDPANSYRAYTEHVPVKYLGKSLIEELELVHDRIGHCHFKDYKYVDGLAKPFTHIALGEGDMKWREYLKIMDKYAYHGAISCEPEVEQLVDVRRSLDYLQSINN